MCFHNLKIMTEMNIPQNHKDNFLRLYFNHINLNIEIRIQVIASNSWESIISSKLDQNNPIEIGNLFSKKKNYSTLIRPDPGRWRAQLLGTPLPVECYQQCLMRERIQLKVMDQLISIRAGS